MTITANDHVLPGHMTKPCTLIGYRVTITANDHVFFKSFKVFEPKKEFFENFLRFFVITFHMVEFGNN